MNRIWGVRLGDVVNVTMGQAPAGETYNETGEGLPLIAGAGDFGRGVPTVKKYTSSPTKVCRSGDIVMSIRATIGTKVVADRDYCLGRGVAGLRTTSAMDQGYLWHWLTHVEPELAAKGRGATFPQVSRADIVDLGLELPSLNEQQRIAAILDKADALRQKRKSAIALLDSLTQSIFLEMFGDADTSWSVATIAELGRNIRTGPFGSQLLHSEFVSEGIAVLGIDNVVQNTFAWGKPRFITPKKYRSMGRYSVYPGDVLITIMGTIGRCAVVPDEVGDAINTKHLCCITPDTAKVLPEYLKACFLGHPEVLRQLGQQSKGAIMDGLNMGIIKGLAIPVPPLALQRRFANAIEAVSTRLREALASERRHEALFATLQHRAFSGQL